MLLKNKIYRLFDVCIYILTKFLSYFYPKSDIWLISERGVDARDNGVCLFLYLKENCPWIKSYYVITNDSPDIIRLDKYRDSLICYKSIKHYLYYNRADVLISTHIYGFAPVPSMFMKLHKLFGINKKKFTVMLQHGITKDYIQALDYKNTNLNLMVCGAQPEYEFMKEANGYSEDRIRYLGFCRFDNLLTHTSIKRQILIMPTWRTWLTAANILKSDYVENYLHLILDERLISFTKQNNYKIIFYPHHEVQPYINVFKNQNIDDNVIIADKYNFDVQTLLKESALLVTDYSSVFFDFAYMKKPVCFYQFDVERYRNYHYSEGYFNYEDSFGPVAYDCSTLVDNIITTINNNNEVLDIYKKNVDKYFPISDSNNCKRTVDYIQSQRKRL